MSVYDGDPVAVLRDRGVQNAVAIAGNSAFHKRGLEFGQVQRGGGQNIIGFTKNFLVQNSGIQVDTAGLTLGAGELNLNHITWCDIAHAKHLRHSVRLGVKCGSGAVNVDGEVVFLALIQPEAHQTGRFCGVTIGDTAAAAGFFIVTVTGLRMGV